MKVSRRILPIGGSKAVTLPARWLKSQGLECGDEVEVTVNGREVVVRLLPTLARDARDEVR